MSDFKNPCPHCKSAEVTGTWAIVDRQQGIILSVPEPLCDACANDLRTVCPFGSEIKKVS